MAYKYNDNHKEISIYWMSKPIKEFIKELEEIEKEGFTNISGVSTTKGYYDDVDDVIMEFSKPEKKQKNKSIK